MSFTVVPSIGSRRTSTFARPSPRSALPRPVRKNSRGDRITGRPMSYTPKDHTRRVRNEQPFNDKCSLIDSAVSASTPTQVIPEPRPLVTRTGTFDDTTLSLASLATTKATLETACSTLDAGLSVHGLKVTLSKADDFVSEYSKSIRELEIHLDRLHRSLKEGEDRLAQAVAGQKKVISLPQFQQLAGFKEQVDEIVSDREIALETTRADISQKEDEKMRKKAILDQLKELEKSTKASLEAILGLDNDNACNN